MIVGTAFVASTGIAAAAPSYFGSLAFGAPTVTRTCAQGVPTRVRISVPFNASHLTVPVSREVTAKFLYQGVSLGYLRAAAPINVTLRPSETGPLVETFTVPTDRPYNELIIGLGAGGGVVDSSEQVPLSCGTAPATFLAPAVGTVSHPCLAATTARVLSSSNRSWTLRAIVNGRTTTTTVIAPHASTTVRIGNALQGAERFRLTATTSGSGTSATVAISDFDKACVRGTVRTSLTALHQGTSVRISAVERPILPTGTPVDFYRLVGGRRQFVGMARTNATGHAVVVTAYAGRASYVAVVTATHYSYATTTATTSMP